MSSKHILVALLLLGCAADGPDGDEPAAPSEPTGGAETVASAPVETPGPEPTAPPPLDPIDCAGAERIALAGVTITNPDGPAIRASGECEVSLTDSEVRGSTYGVEASGTARVTLEDSRVSGGEAAVVSVGTAEVRLRETEVRGEVRVLGAPSSDGEDMETDDG